jgi:gamma-glutamylcyclotransferase (GGCT)/AIG2-like uncharacterized protein YtfP
MNCDLLFVYGTLRRGSGSPMHGLLAAEADFVSDAAFRGRLYLIGDYPGAVPSDACGDVVRGELYRLHRPEDSLAWIDRYEQCGNGFPAPQEYLRQIRQVILPDGSVCKAWIYLYNHSVKGRPHLPSGDFSATRKRGQDSFPGTARGVLGRKES